MPQYITVKDIMYMYKCSKTTVYNWVEEGMPMYKFGRMTRFVESEIIEWHKSRVV